MKNYLKIIFIILLVATITGCGGIDESDRKVEENYREMLDTKFQNRFHKEFTITNDQTVNATFTAYGKVEDVKEHVIDATLKDDPSVEFRICTGYSEEATLSLEYGYKTNYDNFVGHDALVKMLKDNKMITLVSDLRTTTLYSNCKIDYYYDYLIFDETKSVKEIATELSKMDFTNTYIDSLDFKYGDVDYCINVDYLDPSVQSYEGHLNRAIKNALDPENEFRICS